MKTNRLLTFGFVFLFALTACGKKDKTFKSEAGIEITMDASFQEKELISQTLYLESKDMVFTALKEDKWLFEQLNINFETYSLNSYTELVISSNNLSVNIENKEGLVFFKYEKQASGKNFTYKAYTFKGSDAFWLCQFGVKSKNYDALSNNMTKYAKTIDVQ